MKRTRSTGRSIDAACSWGSFFNIKRGQRRAEERGAGRAEALAALFTLLLWEVRWNWKLGSNTL